MGLPYPEKNSVILFREPFPRKDGDKYIVKACVDSGHEQDIRMDMKQQKDMVDYIVKVDLKLTNAVVRCDAEGRFVLEKHSPQSDFFDKVGGE